MADPTAPVEANRPFPVCPPTGSGPAAIEDRYRNLFSGCPIALWEEDITELVARLDKLRAEGVTDIRAHLAAHPEEVAHCVGLIRVVAVNRATLEMYRAPDERSLLGNLAAVFTEESFATFRDIVIAFAEGKREFEGEAVNRTLLGDKLYVNLRWSLLPDNEGKLTRVLLSVTDHTNHTHAKELLAESERKYRDLFESATDAIFILDLQGNFIDVNRTAYTRLGYTKAELLALHISRLDPPEFGARVPERLALLRDRGAAIFESVHLRKDGSGMPVEVNSRLLDYEGQKVFFSVIRDITERKQAEDRIRQSEEFVRSMLDTVDEGFIVVDRDYRIVTANRAYGAMVGLGDKTVVGLHCHEVAHRQPRPCFEQGVECAVRRVFETGKPATALHRHPGPEGTTLFVETRAFPLAVADGRVITATETITNITERHLLEEERLKTQKLESIGTFAGGIAHDFNNLLQGVFGYISMARISIGSQERLLAMLDQAEKALHLSVNLTTQLLTFSKGGKPVKQPIALAPVIENAARFALSGSRSECRMRTDLDLWQANADKGQIAQVIQNIVLNAGQAMPLGGQVTITARNLPAAVAVSRHGLQGGDFVEIVIEDQGIGIPAQYLDKIFDPYFTTKEKGSGLGLATSYSIVRNHGGRIEARSTVGTGTTLVIFLPAIATAPATETRPEPETASRAAKILFMDDDEMIRSVAAEMLRLLGHEVEFAEKGEAAIEKYTAARAAGKPFDMVILDLTIRGGMGGAETMRRLLQIDPGVKAVVTSGYSDDAVIASYQEHGFQAFLKKPFQLQELKRTISATAGG